jgi:clan AA aspartic protease
MVLNGYIDEKNQLWVEITVAGQHNKQKIPVLVDTGFTGELQLPLKIAVPLGLRLAGVGTFVLADGSRSREMLFDASISWGTTVRSVTVSVMDSDIPLLGGGLLHGYVLLVDFEKKLLTIKEPGTDEPQASAVVTPLEEDHREDSTE